MYLTHSHYQEKMLLGLNVKTAAKKVFELEFDPDSLHIRLIWATSTLALLKWEVNSPTGCRQ